MAILRRSRTGREPSRRLRTERRISCRYPSKIRDALLSWDEKEIRAERQVRLEDLSVLGCRLRCRSGPPHRPGLLVQLSIPNSEIPDVIAGVLVSSRRSIFGPAIVRIRFLRSLHYALFTRLVGGVEESVVRQGDIPEHETDALWR